MTTKAHIVNLGPNAAGLVFHCPGCDDNHLISTSVWKWNGSEESPTITPSIFVHGFAGQGEYPGAPDCHSYVTDGQIQFLNDSTHALAGQTVDLPDWPL